MTRRGEGQERGSVISLLPKPQTPLKSPGPHACCGGGGDERVRGGAWGCGSALPRADRCGAVPAAVPVRLQIRAGRGACSTWAVPTPFWFPIAQQTTLSSPSSWFQGPPRDALIGWDGCPGLVNLRRRGRGEGAGLQRALRPAPPRPAPPWPRAPERAPPTGARCERRPGAREGLGASAQRLLLPFVTERTVRPRCLFPQNRRQR
ncbi:uncharacterized protein LOC130857157 [Hippopotamus amphibius kiboko]|uniref:uncharacterized protein LOC130857157 n=1 Tax=Hippopotamus amphibius kiboko TaxID=575201 RepID=UPI002599C067|nr:uncharacterized protein LOC130857157 [Hippopotamus amphibius kiboko]